MEDHFSDSSPLALSRLIEAGEVTHSLTCDPTRIENETELLQALCGAVAGQIYRLGPLSYVFQIVADDLGGTLREHPSRSWGEIVADRLRSSIGLAPADSLRVESLAPAILPAASHGIELREETATVQGEEAADEPGRAALEADVMERASPAATAEAALASPALQRSDAIAGPSAADASEPESTGDPVAFAFGDRISAIEQGIVRIEGLIADLAARETAAAEAFVTLGSRLGRIEHQIGCGLGEIRERLAPLGPSLDALAAGQISDRGRMEELADVIARLPDRSAAAMAARGESLAPASVALNGVLGRLEERAGALLARLDRCEARSAAASEDEDNQAAMTEFLARVEQVLSSDPRDGTSGRVRNIRGL